MSVPQEAIDADQIKRVVWQVKHREMSAAEAIARLCQRIAAAREEGVAADRDRIATSVRELRDRARRLSYNMPPEIAVGLSAQEEVLTAVLELIGGES